jgi:putative tryptophan/tyrosine transport system substrate-binding protein
LDQRQNGGNGRLTLRRRRHIALPGITILTGRLPRVDTSGNGPSIVQTYRQRVSRLLVQLLHRTKSANLPVQQPTTFELVINLKTAKALGLPVPPLLLRRPTR